MKTAAIAAVVSTLFALPALAQGVVMDIPAPIWPDAAAAPVAQGCLAPTQVGGTNCR